MLVVAAYHVAGDILQEQHRHPALVTQLHKVRALERAIVEQNAVVAEDTDLEAPDAGKPANQRGAVGRLIFVKTAAIDQARDDLTDVELDFDVARNDTVKLFWIVVRRLRRNLFDVELGGPRRLRYQFARDRNRLLLACCRIIGGTGDARVHIGAAQFFDRHVLAGRRLHERRPAEEDGAGAANDHVVFAQCRHVGAARRAMTEHDGNLRNAHLRENRLIAENAPGEIAIGEDVGLQREKAARTIAQVNDRQPVLDRDVERTNNLLYRQWIPSSALHACVVGMDDDFTAVDDANAADDAGAGYFAAIFAVGGKRGEFKKRRARIEQQLDSVAHEHLVLPRQTFQIARRPLAAGSLLALPERVGQAAIMGAVEPELLGGDIDAAFDTSHRQASARGASVSNGAPR